MSVDETPRVWVGCLSCYNNGDLVGYWVDAVDAPQDMPAWDAGGSGMAKAHAYLAGRGFIHEELWVFDFENFGGLLKGECSPADAVRLGEAVEAINDDGYPLDAVAAWLSNGGETLGDWADISEAFQDSYYGEYDSGRDYAMELAEGTGVDLSVPVWPFTCIDWDRAWNELRLGDGMWTEPTGTGSVYIFRAV